MTVKNIYVNTLTILILNTTSLQKFSLEKTVICVMIQIISNSIAYPN